jgi:predicted double-glycine peptidase
MNLDVPYFKQDTVYSCGVASLQMALDFFGVFESEEKLAKEAHTNREDGTTYKWMIEVATKKGFYCYVNNESSLEEIGYFLEQKLPVLVRFIEPSNNEDHYSIITGIQKEQIVMNDPWNGAGFRMGYEDFSGRWHSADGSHVRWMMVLSKEKIPLGRQFMPQ